MSLSSGKLIQGEYLLNWKLHSSTLCGSNMCHFLSSTGLSPFLLCQLVGTRDRVFLPNCYLGKYSTLRYTMTDGSSLYANCLFFQTTLSRLWRYLHTSLFPFSLYQNYFGDNKKVLLFELWPHLMVFPVVYFIYLSLVLSLWLAGLQIHFVMYTRTAK